MPFTPEQLLDFLAENAIDVTTHHHAPAFTVEDSKAVRGDLPGVHCKNLFLKDKKGQLWLCVSSEDTPVNLKELKHKIGSAHLSFAKPDLLMAVLGVEPGSVTPFALVNDREKKVSVVLEKAMMSAALVNYHPLDNAKTTALPPEGLRRFLSVLGYDFQEVDL